MSSSKLSSCFFFLLISILNLIFYFATFFNLFPLSFCSSYSDLEYWIHCFFQWNTNSILQILLLLIKEFFYFLSFFFFFFYCKTISVFIEQLRLFWQKKQKDCCCRLKLIWKLLLHKCWTIGIEKKRTLQKKSSK